MSATSPSETRPGGVLVVEDERIVALDIQEMLVSMGYDAFAIACSSAEALERASERTPEVVLMDIRIRGDVDGIDTAAIMKERYGACVVYLTAHADEATVSRAILTKPESYLLKPVKPVQLRSSIDACMLKLDLERRLRASERLASLGTYARGFARAVDKPLSIASGNLDFALNEIDLRHDVVAEVSDRTSSPKFAEQIVESLCDAQGAVDQIGVLVAGLRRADSFTRITRRARVLLVDDDLMVSKAIRNMLAQTHDVTIATSGSDALALLEKGDRLDVLILDVIMPEMSGLELYDELCKQRPDLARSIIFLSGGNSPADLERIAKLPNRRLEKPVTGEALRAAVDEVILDTAEPKALDEA